MIYLLTTSLLETQTLRHLWRFLFECDDNYSVFGYGYEHGRHSGTRRRRLMWVRHKTWFLALTSLTTLHISFILSVVASHWSRVITWPEYWPLIGREEDDPLSLRLRFRALNSPGVSGACWHLSGSQDQECFLSAVIHFHLTRVCSTDRFPRPHIAEGWEGDMTRRRGVMSRSIRSINFLS